MQGLPGTAGKDEEREQGALRREGKGDDVDSSSRHCGVTYSTDCLQLVACREGQMQGEKEDAFLAQRKITVKLSSDENTPGMRERMGGGGAQD